jgi:hypothetical protein
VWWQSLALERVAGGGLGGAELAHDGFPWGLWLDLSAWRQKASGEIGPFWPLAAPVGAMAALAARRAAARLAS